MNNQILSITPRALIQIKQLLSKKGNVPFGIRIGIKSGGCSGYKYYLEYVDSKDDSDELISLEQINILIDSKALLYLINTEMDYIEDKFYSGFSFKNPNAKNTCGCNNSFNI